MGMGKMSVEFFSADTSVMVWSILSCKAIG